MPFMREVIEKKILTGEVIEEFKKGFQYLDKTQHRQSKWYEFWYKNESLRQNFTNTALTAAIEKAVKNCNTKLDLLIQDKGKKGFNENRQEFLNCLAEVLNTVRKERFNHGKKTAHTFMHRNQSIFERVLIPENNGFLEQSVVSGLKKIANKYPELKDKMEEMIKKVQAGVSPYVEFHESMTIYADGTRFFSASNQKSTLECHLEKVALKFE
ncbi:hypothetical protein [Legionella clemsonensis]|uniref:Uncharacterized protein n=1 Tax=Legionella clemsonensis TaxID=1867846 RepID=A0A222P3C3_9GAMM|nr:hypothetical protein [Legionella clemsonensis]ASQ46339.1 hypothetical protein clem_08940 [Legionella clemsonensis]